jgi:hypothetical protein
LQIAKKKLKGGDRHMENNKKDQQLSKFDKAEGLFWGASLFIGALTAINMGFRGNMHSDWLFAILVGGCAFLIIGLVAQGVIALVKKD